MSEEITNYFFKGMIKDVSDTMKDPSSFDEGYDIRLNANDSDSEHVVVNIKGNKFSFNIPNIPNIVTITPATIPSSWLTSVSITHSGGTVTGSVFTGNTDNPDSLMDAIENALRTDPVLIPLTLNIARNGNIIRIWSTVTQIIAYNQFSSLTTSVLQIAQSNQLPIGWTRIDDSIYIISTNNDTPTGGIAAFYKIVYDKVSLVPTITLVYSDDLNMTTMYPIANPGGIESAKETDGIIRTYWTDRLNNLRSMNLADPNIMAVTPLQLLMNPNVILTKPTLKSIQDGGSLYSGHYEVSYALRTRGGGISTYAHASNSIFINEDSINNGYSDYQGQEGSVLTGKSFTVRITDIDTSFDSIDIIVLRTESADASPIISKVAELAITSDTIEYTHTGSEPASIITEDSFNKRINVFDKCHALAQKDNILFAANTESEPYDLDFDARAYRFDSNQLTQLNDTNGNSITPSYTDLINTPFFLDETEDTINPDQKIYRYQSDGQTLGGEGPNVKYEFTYRSLAADTRVSVNYFSGIYAYPYKIPWLVGDDATISLGDGTLYTEGGYYSDFKSPYIDHIYRGNRRGETYRYSLVPVKNNREGYAKWIADIRMPDIFEDYQAGNTIASAANIGKVFPLMSSINGVWHVNTLGVKFTVTIPDTIKDDIDEYYIKRVKLEPEERTVVAQGIAHMCISNISTNTYHPTLGEPDVVSDYSTLPDFTSNPIGIGGSSLPLLTFHSPDLLFGRPISKRSGDKLRIVQGLGTALTTRPKEGVSIPALHTVFTKLYHSIPYKDPLGDTGIFDVIEARNAAFDDDFTIGVYDFENRSTFSATLNGRRSRGTDTTVLVLDRGIPLDAYINMQGSSTDFYPRGGSSPFHADKYLVNYERDNTGQYGGQGYAARSQNVYINTGCHVIINPNNLTETVNVYGGDTYVNVFDSLKMTKNFIDFNASGDDTKRVALGLYYPVESFVNTDMRHGYSINGDQNPSGYFYDVSGTSNADAPDPAQFPLDYGEDFKYNYVFSEQMDTQRSFPKPLNSTQVLKHPVRIWASAPKVYGELTDAWRIFDSEKYIDIQGDLGEIRQLMNTSDQIVAFQQRGLGVASVNERSVVNDNIGGGIVLGQSGVLPRFDYISKTIGSWHQFSFIKSPNGVMFWDSKDAGLYIYNSQGIKDVSVDKIKGWLYANTRGNILKHDSPLPTNNITRIGVCGTYDTRNREFLITFYDNNSNLKGSNYFDLIGKSFTIGYNDTKDRFTGFKSFKPTMYINDDRYAITANPSDENKLYLHDIGDRGVFYDNSPSKSYIITTINQAPKFTKLFDVTEFLTEVIDSNGNELPLESVNEITSYNSYQTTGIRTDIKRTLRNWRHVITYELNTRNRLRSHWMKQKFSFLNNNNKEFKLHHITNYFRRGDK